MIWVHLYPAGIPADHHLNCLGQNGRFVRSLVSAKFKQITRSAVVTSIVPVMRKERKLKNS